MNDVDVQKIYDHIPRFKRREDNNEDIVDKWRALLGDTVPTHSYNVDTNFVNVVVRENYGDLELGREMSQGEVVTMRRDRAIMLINRGFVEKV